MDDIDGETPRRCSRSTRAQLSKKSPLAGAIHYALSRWRVLTRYCEDGRIEIDNNPAKRSLRVVALGRKNYLFAGSDAGGERAAAIYSLLGTAKLTVLIRKVICATCSRISPNIRSIASRSCSHGISRCNFNVQSSSVPEFAPKV